LFLVEDLGIFAFSEGIQSIGWGWGKRWWLVCKTVGGRKLVDMNKVQVRPGKRMASSKNVMVGNQKTVSSWKGR
jgi:hypothetical protein